MLAVPGVDVVQFGPADYSISVGVVQRQLSPLSLAEPVGFNFKARAQ